MVITVSAESSPKPGTTEPVGEQHNPAGYRPGELSVMADQLVIAVSSCTCSGGLEYYGHEPHCGWEPVADVAEVRRVLAAGSGTAALTDHQLPEPDDEDEYGPLWESPAGRVRVEDGLVKDDDRRFDSGEAEFQGWILIAAARRLAADEAGDGDE